MPEPRRPYRPPQRPDSEFLDYLKKGMLIGAAVLLLIPAVGRFHRSRAPEQPPQVATAPQAQAPRIAPAPGSGRPAPVLRLADFRGEQPSAEARLVGNWVVATGDAQQHAFVLVDKKNAHVWVFGPDGRLRDGTPALMGAARGDDSYPGIGDKPLNQVKPYEKTTPAGRFVAEMGLNAGNEDIVWVSYDLAVSMHRVRPLVARERRLERLATLTTDDNRISFGCINLPVSFYEDVLKPTVQAHGAVVYVLPEVKTPQQVFGAWDVTDPQQAAAVQARARQVAGAAPVLQKVSLPPAR